VGTVNCENFECNSINSDYNAWGITNRLGGCLLSSSASVIPYVGQQCASPLMLITAMVEIMHVNVTQQLQALLDDVRRETEVLRSQLNSERSTKQGLEGLIQDNHTKGWQTQMTIQERETEIQLLRDRLALNESKMYVLS